MVSPDFANFFIASTGASAALLGLLFVSVSIGLAGGAVEWVEGKLERRTTKP